MKMIMREKWFYGFLSKSESEHLLNEQEPGANAFFPNVTLARNIFDTFFKIENGLIRNCIRVKKEDLPYSHPQL